MISSKPGGTPGGPITGNRVVPCSWQKTRQGGPMLVAGDTHACRSADVMMSRVAGLETAKAAWNTACTRRRRA